MMSGSYSFKKTNSVILRAAILGTGFILSVTTLGFGANEISKQTRDDVVDEIVIQLEEFEKSAEQPRVRKEEKPEITIEEEIHPEVEPSVKGPIFYVRQIRFTGNQAVPTEELQKLTKPFEGEQLSFQELRSAAQLITNYYRAKGYVTSRAYVPVQTLLNDTVEIQIREGKISRILVQGNRHFKSSLYERTLDLPKDKAFRYQDLEANLSKLNREPDREAKAYLIAGEKPQTSDIIFKVKDQIPVHINHEFHNRGSKFTHRARNVINLTHNNLLGLGDVFNTSVSLAEEGAFRAIFMNYQLTAIPSLKTVFSIGSAMAHSRLVKDLKPLNITGDYWSLTPAIQQPLIRTPRFSLDYYLGFEIKDSKTSLNNLKIAFDRMRVLRTGPRLSYQDRLGRSALSVDLHVGIPKILGASSKSDPNASQPGTGGEFFYATANVTRIHRLPLNSFLVLRSSGQLTNRSLTSLEQFRAGGAYSVRGYPESDSVGDNGVQFSSELRVPLIFIPRDWIVPLIQKKLWNSVYLIGFIDGAETSLLHRPVPASEKDRFLLGTGFGLRVDWEPYVTVELDMGYPFGNDSTDKNRTITHLLVRSGF